MYKLRNGLILKFDNKNSGGFNTDLLLDVFVRRDYGDISEDMVIVDIGANIGLFSLYSTFEKNNICYAFEPDRDNFKLLLENIYNNGLGSKIIAFNYAISSEKGKKKLYKSISIAHSLDRISNEYEFVECITLKDVFEKNRLKKIDLLKIDCEGGEYPIIYSSPVSLFENIKCIRLEYHNFFQEGNYNGDSLVRYLKEVLRYKVLESRPVDSEVMGIVDAVKI